MISRGFILSRSSPSTLFSFPKNQQGSPLYEDISTLAKPVIITLGRQRVNAEAGVFENHRRLRQVLPERHKVLQTSGQLHELTM